VVEGAGSRRGACGPRASGDAERIWALNGRPRLSAGTGTDAAERAAALHNNIGLLPWSPLAAGFLSGKYQRGEKAGTDTRAGAGNPMNDHIFGDLAAKDQNWATLDVVRDIAASISVTPSQVAYSWVTNRPAVTAPIVGAKTLTKRYGRRAPNYRPSQRAAAGRRGGLPDFARRLLTSD
jgi:hypothetical protein